MALNFLTQKNTLWLLLAITLITTVSFGVVMHIWDFLLIDEMYDAEQISAHISALSAEQKQVHIWTTATLDVLYPLVYGLLFAGVALKAFGKNGLLLALPSLLCIPADLSEGFAQVMLLSGNADYMGLKTAMTPIKFALFFPGFLIAIVGAVKLYRGRNQSIK